MADDPTSNKAPVAVLEYEPSAFEVALLKHKTKLILVGVIALLGTLGYWGYRLYKEATHKSAAVEFTRAETVEELKKVAAEHASQTAGGDATILAAEFVSAERPKEAIAMLQGLLSKTPNHPLAPLASWRVAEYHALAGDTAGAEKEYDAVAKAGTAFSAFALLRLGDLKWGAGDTAAAQDIYNRILSSGSMAGSPARAVAQKRVEVDLKVKPPVIVEYKEEPPPPTPGAPNSTVPGLGDIPGLGDFNTVPGGPSGDSLLPPPLLPQLPADPPVPIPPAPTPPPGSTPPAENPPPAEAPNTPAETPKPAAATEPAPADSEPAKKEKK